MAYKKEQRKIGEFDGREEADEVEELDAPSIPESPMSNINNRNDKFDVVLVRNVEAMLNVSRKEAIEVLH